MEESFNIESPEVKLITNLPGFGAKAALEVRSPAWPAGEWMPKKYTQEGRNISPPVIWLNAPRDAEELVFICEDPNAPRPDAFVHWIIYGIDPEKSSLEEAIPAAAAELPDGTKQGINSRGQLGWIGPMPPVGHGPHFYHFQLFALDKKLNLPAGAARDELVAQMAGHIIAEGTFIGIYERPGSLG